MGTMVKLGGYALCERGRSSNSSKEARKAERLALQIRGAEFDSKGLSINARSGGKCL